MKMMKLSLRMLSETKTHLDTNSSENFTATRSTTNHMALSGLELHNNQKQTSTDQDSSKNA